MKALIIEDEARARKSLSDLLRLSQHRVEVIAEAEDVKSGLAAIRKYEPELVFLDINLPDGSGFDILRKLENINFKIIFVTAYEEFAIQAFQFSAVDYLLKPVDPAKLTEALDRAWQLIDRENISLKINALFANLDNKTGNKKLVLKTAENIYLVNTSDIIRCESDGSYTRFYLADRKKIMVSKNIKEFEDMLNGLGFFRIHQSHLISLKYIDHYSKGEGGSVIMKDNSELPVARRKKESFLKLLEMI